MRVGPALPLPAPEAAPARPPGPLLLTAPLGGAGPDGRPLRSVLVRVGPGGVEALERVGARIGVRAGDVVTAHLPAEAIEALEADPAIRFIEAASWLIPGRPALLAPGDARPGRSGLEGAPAMATDSAVDQIGVAGLRRRSGDRFFGLAGQGVLVGIFDTGLDLTHPDFRDEAGRTRIIYAWDQITGSGRPPGVVGDQIFEYGTECARPEIDEGGCPLTDLDGHGTHVAGIAAGTGAGTGNGLPAYRFTGVAPAAEMIVVRGGDSGYTSAQLLEGVAYIMARAAELGRPVVINLSVTTQAGPHDGSTLLDRGLDQLSGPGRIIVAGAGNQGVNANERPAFARALTHAMATLAPGGSETHQLIIPSYTPRPGVFNDGAVLELWYDGRDSLEVVITTPGGTAAATATGDSTLALTPDGAIFVANAVGGPQAINGDNQVLIAIADSSESTPPTTGEWEITVTRRGGTGTGEYHLWLVGGTFDSADLARLEGGATNSHTIGSPATADRVIAVAAYAGRHEWRGTDGDLERFPFEEPLGDIAFFSSPGPRRDGVLKPEITAPGKMVISSRAESGSTWTGLPWLVEEDGVHGALLGTSMAAPFVTGAIALLLQLEPGLTPERAREVITGTARRDRYTREPRTGEPAGTPNNQWGYGKLDIAAATRVLRPDTGVEGRVVALSANPVRGQELVLRYPRRPDRIAIYTFTGQLVRAFGEREIGDQLTVWDLTNSAGREVANGAYLIVVEAAGERALEKLFVVRP